MKKSVLLICGAIFLLVLMSAAGYYYYDFNKPRYANLSWDHSKGAISYKVYYGNESKKYNFHKTIWNVKLNNGQCSYKLENLERGKTYYLAISAIYSDGVESAKSYEVIHKTE